MPILLAFYGGLFACSSGETGLVLGRPEVQLAGGAGGASGAAGAAEAGQPDAGGSSNAGMPAEAGAGGDAGAVGGDPTWVTELCTPAITFDNQSPMGDGKAFNDAVPRPGRLMWEATHAVCRTLYRNANEITPVPDIALTVGPFDGVAGTVGTSITMSAAHLKMLADAGADLPPEIAGILHFQTSFIYQNHSADTSATRWLLFGIADFVRLQAGYLDRASRAAPTASYDRSGSQTVAFFLDYLAQQNPDIVYQLNQSLAAGAAPWSVDVFIDFMGADLDTLWAEYRATF